MTNLINVVGIGLDGAAGLAQSVQKVIEAATVLVGSDRHLSYFPNQSAKRIVLKDFSEAIAQIRQHYEKDECIVVLVSGDPLFFGLGRLLLSEFPSECLQFYPHVSSIQLAFSRIKIPWQDAKVISVHGRSSEALIKALQQGEAKIALLTDTTNTPSAIAHLIQSLDLPITYDFWVCENLGSSQEKVNHFSLDKVQKTSFSPLNVVVLLRQESSQLAPKELQNLPKIGLPDRVFLSFRDRPGLMTKREVRLLILGELALQAGQTVWDLGAGTGSVAIEIARFCPTSQVYAVEKTAMGKTLIEQNCQRLQVTNVTVIQGNAPDTLPNSPPPDRIFIGGSGGNLAAILDACVSQIAPLGSIVLAFATLEHLHASLDWLRSHNWRYQLLQAQLSRSVPIGQLTRFSPLNPVTIVTATPCFLVKEM